MRTKGFEFRSLTAEQRKTMYEHVLYEMTSAFCPPRFGAGDSELRESVYLRVMISVRNLTSFFTFDETKKYFSDDVFAWQFFDGGIADGFKGVANAPQVPKSDLDKINKQIAHLCLGRASFTGDMKRW